MIDVPPSSSLTVRLVSRALDNRLGSFVSAPEAARIVAEAGGGQWEVVLIAAVQEETTFGGSATSAFSLDPDAAIADPTSRTRRTHRTSMFTRRASTTSVPVR